MTPKISGNSDAQLVEWSLTGDRAAFATIVKRYQSLVCSITYNATGSLSLSEDLAQETFFAAWKQLSELREPARLRSWLCGIARFLVGKEFRRRGREPMHAAEPLDAIQESPSPEASPSMQAISREEEAILWRALERIPDTYREPLILFYREEQSIERVAAELELSEDAVKQRLSRGRKLLHEEVLAFVEGTLSRTAPGQAFSNSVLALLPAAPAASVGTGMAGKGAMLVKSDFLAAWLAPFVGVFAGILAHWLIVRAVPTARERRFQKFSFIALWVFVLAWCVVGQFAVRTLRQRYAWSDQPFYAVMTGFWWFYSVVVATFTVLLFRRIVAMRPQSQEKAAISKTTRTPLNLGPSFVIVFGLYLSCFSWLIYLAWRVGDQVSAGIMAGIMVVLGIWHFFQLRSPIGTTALRAAIGHTALVWGLILLILNLRWDVWLAAIRGTNLAEIHRILPVWVVPLATLTLLIWVGVVFALTGPQRAASKPGQR
jgi:RNA polymerase sigma factor (sigma-70 family)